MEGQLRLILKDEIKLERCKKMKKGTNFNGCSGLWKCLVYENRSMNSYKLFLHYRINLLYNRPSLENPYNF